MPNEILLNYLKEQLENGVSLQEVVIACRSAGWPDTEIEIATKALEASTPATSTPVRFKPLLLGVLGLTILTIGLVAYLFSAGNRDKQVVGTTVDSLVAASTTESRTISFVKEGITFTTLTSSPSDRTPGAGVISDIWAAGDMLAFVTSATDENYVPGSFPVLSQHRLYVGSTSTPYELAPGQNSTTSRITPVPSINSHVTFYTSGSNLLYFGDKRYPFTDVIFDITASGSDILYSDSSGIRLNGTLVEDDAHALQRTPPGMAILNGTPAYFKARMEGDAGVGETELLFNGSSTARGILSELAVHRGALAYVKTDLITDTTPPRLQSVVMSNGNAITDSYLDITNLTTVGGELAFLGKKVGYTDSLGYKEAGGYVLVWGGSEYGTKYDMVWGFIESQDRPIYIAAKYPEDVSGEVDPIDGHVIVADNTVLLSVTPSLESISTDDLIEVEGYPAARVFNSETETAYLWYAGEKYLTDHNVLRLVNVNGKLAVLAEKDGKRIIYIEE